ncbi:aldo/keto reductase [Halomarina ordinaria]|uniref:Aldo/keto reductase n=1 Tax=Halomarina ordinaria TaxID=3033939 RepID=A0ABD5U561_9EURY|nr:aldo/keto reductase [Halomarina sp. PSRA2]
MDIAIVGCGTISAAYAAGLAAHDDLSLVAATDLVPERRERFAAAHDCAAAPDLDALLADHDPALVVNLTIHDAHAPVTRACLDAGVHVFSEKPLALDGETATELVELADERGVRLACAPGNRAGDAQRQTLRYLREGRLGEVRLADVTCNLGRTTEWNENPEPFLRVGPLYDGAVYPLTLLTGLFGPVERVLSAHSSLLLADHDHDGEQFSVETPDHTVAVLEHADGTRVQLTASTYVPHRTREFNALELHGDDGSLYLDDTGDTGRFASPRVSFARLGRSYVPVPLQRAPAPRDYADAVADFVRAIETGGDHPAEGERAAHVVRCIEAVERCAEGGGPVPVDPSGAPADEAPAPPAADGGAGVTLPPVGFGCSRYRDGEYVEVGAAVERALDAGYRLLDSAELYGVEPTLGEVLDRPGSPDREALFLVSKVWNTNHAPEDAVAACEKTLRELGVDALDCYMVHWPDAWVNRGSLAGLDSLPRDEQERRTFPTDESGDPLTVDVAIEETWEALESLHDRGLVRSLGVSNFDRLELESLRAHARIPPRVVQFERHPYLPNETLLDDCETHGATPVAHSPLSAPGLLAEEVLAEVAATHGMTPAQVVLRWNVEAGVVPIPSSTDPEHVVENLDVFDFSLSREEIARIDALADPTFSRG